MEVNLIMDYNKSSNLSYFVTTNGFSMDKSNDSGAGISPNLEYYLKGVILPTIGLIGILGNSMNLVVLSWRYRRRDVDVLEKGALLGLIGLAFSDLCFCLGLLPQAMYYKSRTLFNRRGLWLYYQMYSVYYGNVFIKISTGLTLLVGVARYVGICHPLRLNARLFIGLKGIRVAIAIIYIFWVIVLIPMWWNYTVVELNYNKNETYVYLDLGPVAANRYVKLVFTYFWTCFGFFIPVAILVYCNMRLIGALWESARLREMTVRRPSLSSRDYTVKITLTLVFLILSFIILVSPSEILHFYADVVQPENYPAFELAVHCTNLCQALNFAFHFLLYCAVNASFRKSLVQVLASKCNYYKYQAQEFRIVQPGRPYGKFEGAAGFYDKRSRNNRSKSSRSSTSNKSSAKSCLLKDNHKHTRSTKQVWTLMNVSDCSVNRK